MTFPHLRALWAMLRSWGWLVQPDPTVPPTDAPRPGDTHSRKVTDAHPQWSKPSMGWREVGEVHFCYPPSDPHWGRCMEPLTPQWNMAGICAKHGRLDRAAEWAVIALTGTANTVEERKPDHA